MNEHIKENNYKAKKMKGLKKGKWYSVNIKPDKSIGLIVMTDMGYIFEAVYEDGKFLVSIVKNGKDTPGKVRKLYYHENVYRVTGASDGFREQTQVGLECTGALDGSIISEVLKLAAESLKTCAEDFVLEISHVGILSAFVDAIAPDAAVREEILHCAGQKNLHGISGICRENHLAEGAGNALIRLLSLYGTPRTVMPKIRELAEEYGAGEMAAQLGRAAAGFTGSDLENRIQIDFSATGDLRYYNGIAFKGFISGIPGSVLSGGQYDKLMRKMGRKDRAIGFAVFLDMLERLTEEETTRA